MRIAVITDTHANLPALEAALHAIQQIGYDLLVHTGDAIGIGPFPAECLACLLTLPKTRLLMGNHDAWFGYGLPTPTPAWMGSGELQHQQWTHTQLSPTLRTIVREWPYLLSESYEQVTLSFLHYPFTAQQEFIPIMRAPSPVDLDKAFAAYPGELIFYGHHHPQSDIQGRARYSNPGALGCTPTAEARFCMVELSQGTWTVSHHSVPYDDAPLYQAFETREVADRSFIYRAFFGNRFGQ